MPLARTLSKLFRFALNELKFRKVYQKYRDHTMVPGDLYVGNLRLPVWAAGIPGSIVECGTWRGGMIAGIADILGPGRTYYLFDSFQGLPAPSHEADRDYDLSSFTALAVSQADVEAAFERFGLLDDQVKFLKGWFKDTLATAPVSRLAILRMDGDLYESTMDIFDALYHKVSSGGFVIVDDYHLLPPCKQAVHDFRERAKVADPIQEIDGTGVFWKKSG